MTGEEAFNKFHFYFKNPGLYRSWDNFDDEFHEAWNALARELSPSQSERVKELEEALKPFAALIVGGDATAPIPESIWPDDEPHWKAKDHLWGSRITVAMVRRARLALEKSGG